MLKSGEFESSIVFIFFNNFSVLARVKLMQKHTKLMTLFLAMTLLIGCASEPVRKTHTSQKDQSNTTPSQSKVVSKAQSYYQKGDFKNAIATLDSVSMSEVPLKERSEFWNLKGLVELNHKQFALASQNFKHAIEENQQPEYRGYYQYNLATAHFGAGQYQESYDILAAVDLGSIDQPQQHKVLTLKEKASQALKIPQKKTVTTTITGSPDATNQGIGPVVITSPEVVYSGGVNRKKIGLLIPLSGKFEISTLR